MTPGLIEIFFTANWCPDRANLSVGQIIIIFPPPRPLPPVSVTDHWYSAALDSKNYFVVKSIKIFNTVGLALIWQITILALAVQWWCQRIFLLSSENPLDSLILLLKALCSQWLHAVCSVQFMLALHVIRAALCSGHWCNCRPGWDHIGTRISRNLTHVNKFHVAVTGACHTISVSSWSRKNQVNVPIDFLCQCHHLTSLGCSLDLNNNSV